jgi:hypothetical protein
VALKVSAPSRRSTPLVRAFSASLARDTAADTVDQAPTLDAYLRGDKSVTVLDHNLIAKPSTGRSPSDTRTPVPHRST